MRIRWIATVMFAAVVGGTQVAAVAQTDRSSALDAQLQQLGATAQSLQQNLPSFTCTQSAVSQAIKKGKVKQQVRFVAKVQVERTADVRLSEQLQVIEVNGKPYPGVRFEPPFMVKGGFGSSLLYFLPATQACFRFSLSQTGSQSRISFDSLPGSFERPECQPMGLPRGFVLLDDAGRPTHVERTVPPEFGAQVHTVDFAAIDFAPTELDGKVYPLAIREVSEARKDDYELHFEATFADCHLFKATSRILPDVTPDSEGYSEQPKR